MGMYIFTITNPVQRGGSFLGFLGMPHMRDNMISISTEVHALMVTTADSTTLSRALTQFLPYEYCLGGGA